MKALLVVLLGIGVSAAPGQEKKKQEKKKIELKIKGPRMVFMPPSGDTLGGSTTVMLMASLEGEPENPEDYYCLTQKWEWGDEEHSEYSPDCEPYAPGVELPRHFSMTHRYKGPGRFNIILRLERGQKVALLARHSLTIQGGEEPN